jgi:tryptophan 2,3-dioxygenase
MKYPATYYSDYLKLDELLGSCEPLSKKYGEEAHDETLFIIIHQAYELWFKQILHEINSIHAIMNQERVPPNQLATISSRLERIVKIQKILNDQLSIIETMSPLDFMDFRDFLVPASGFQSVQFRQIELKLGLRQEYRLGASQKFFNSRLSEKDKDLMNNLEKEVTLLELIDKWLARMPFDQIGKYNFWDDYQKVIEEIVQEDEKIVSENDTLNEFELKIEMANLKATKENYEQLFNEELYEKYRLEGQNRISRKAKLSAIFIRLHRDEPIFHTPNKIIDLLIDIDEMFTNWRFQHSLMAHRMLGNKIGTGGSSGHEYLKKSADNNRVFVDFFNLSTFLLPKSRLPELPVSLKEYLGFSAEK